MTWPTVIVAKREIAPATETKNDIGVQVLAYLLHVLSTMYSCTKGLSEYGSTSMVVGGKEPFVLTKIPK